MQNVVGGCVSQPKRVGQASTADGQIPRVGHGIATDGRHCGFSVGRQMMGRVGQMNCCEGQITTTDGLQMTAAVQTMPIDGGEH